MACETPLVEFKPMREPGARIVYVGLLVDHSKSQLAGLAVNHSRFASAADDPGSKGSGMMIGVGQLAVVEKREQLWGRSNRSSRLRFSTRCLAAEVDCRVTDFPAEIQQTMINRTRPDAMPTTWSPSTAGR